MASNVPILNYQLKITIHLHLVSFHATKCLWKNLVRGNAYWTNYWIWIEGAWAPGGTYIPKTGYFRDKTKIVKGKSSSALFNAKMLQKAFDFSDLGQVTKFNPKILNVFWTWLEVKVVIFSVGFQTSKILFFQMARKTCEMWSESH